MSAKFKDFKFTSQELVLAMVNAANSLRLDLNRVEFVDPVPTSGTHNTQATMRAKAGGGFEGSFPIKYNRLDFNVLFSAYPVTLDPEVYTSSDQLLPLINEDYGLNLQPEDIVIESVNVVNDKYVLKASASSIAWFGQTDVTFRVDITAVSNFPVTQLNGVFMPAFTPYEFTFVAEADRISAYTYNSWGLEYDFMLGSSGYWGEISQHMPNNGFSYIRIGKGALIDGVVYDLVSLILPSETWPVTPKFIEVNGVRSVKTLSAKDGGVYAFESIPTPVPGLSYQISISNEPFDRAQEEVNNFVRHVRFNVTDMAGTSRALSNLKDTALSYPAGTIGLNLTGGGADDWMVGDFNYGDSRFLAIDSFVWIKRIYWQDEAENSIRIVYEIKDLELGSIPERSFPARLKYGNAISEKGVVESFDIHPTQHWQNAVVVIRYPIAGQKPAAGEALIEFLEEFLTVAR